MALMDMQSETVSRALLTMKTRALGASGLLASEIGFGAWGIGGSASGTISYGPADDAESTRALHLAFESGVTFYDTSDSYGAGHSERLIGAAFRNRRRRIVIATKAGFVSPRGDQDFSPAHLRRALTGSLERLQTDYIDLYQLHNPPPECLMAENPTLATLRAFVEEGSVRAIGVSVRSPDDGLAAARLAGVQAIQVNFSLVDQRALGNGLLDVCAHRGIGVIARTPLCYGFLSGAYGPDSVFDPRDHRSARSAEQRARWSEAVSQFAEAIVDRSAATPAQTALRYCLSYSAVTVAIPGMRTASHVGENVAASALGPLPDAQRAAIERVYRDHVFFIPPSPAVPTSSQPPGALPAASHADDSSC